VNPPVCTVTLLAEADTYVDPAAPTSSFADKPISVSSTSRNEQQKVGFVRFDLTPVPRDATIVACWMAFTIADPAAKQVVKLLRVDDDGWSNDITFETQPTPSDAPVGAWYAAGATNVSSIVRTNPVNPVLVALVQDRLGVAGERKLSVQLCSTFAWDSPAENHYHSTATATESSTFANAPRLVVQYQPAPTPLPRSWGQHRADQRRSARSNWTLAEPATYYVAETVVSNVEIAAAPIVVDGLVFFCSPTALRVVSPTPASRKLAADSVLLATAYGLHSLAAGPGVVLYGASTTELACFDLAAGGTQTVSVALTDGTEKPGGHGGGGPMAVGADGSAYVVQGDTLWCYVAHLGTLAPSWTTPLGSEGAAPVALSTDGSIAYVAAPGRLCALDTTDGSEIWVCRLDQAATHLTTPVAGAANGLSYFGVDDTVYVFKHSNLPQTTIHLKTTDAAQLVIDGDDTLVILDGSSLSTVHPNGEVGSTGVIVPHLHASRPLEPVIDRTGTMFIIDDNNTLFRYRSDLSQAAPPESLSINEPVDGVLIAPDGSLLCHSATALYRLTPSVGADVDVSSFADASCYRADSSLRLSNSLPSGACISFRAGATITIQPKFGIPVGSEASFNTGS
jgi:outer membrane protein assembly factor BamB